MKEKINEKIIKTLKDEAKRMVHGRIEIVIQDSEVLDIIPSPRLRMTD